MSKPNIVEAMSDRRLFEPWFRGPSWDGWKAMLKAAHGIPMQPEEIKLLHKLAERDPPKRQVREFWVCGGRRTRQRQHRFVEHRSCRSLLRWRQEAAARRKSALSIVGVLQGSEPYRAGIHAQLLH